MPLTHKYCLVAPISLYKRQSGQRVNPCRIHRLFSRDEISLERSVCRRFNAFLYSFGNPFCNYLEGGLQTLDALYRSLTGGIEYLTSGCHLYLVLYSSEVDVWTCSSNTSFVMDFRNKKILHLILSCVRLMTNHYLNNLN